MFCFEKSVGAVVFRRDGDKIYFLLLHYKSGHWDFPKGHIEKGESNEQTLRREVKEETGINDLKILPDFERRVYYVYRAKGEERKKRIKSRAAINIFKKVAYHLAKTKTEEIKISSEHINYKWLEYKEALEKITYRGPRRILKKAGKYLNREV